MTPTEIDAALAVEVMEWEESPWPLGKSSEWRESELPLNDIHGWTMSPNQGVLVRVPENSLPDFNPLREWRPTRDANCTLEVLERMEELGFVYVVTVSHAAFYKRRKNLEQWKSRAKGFSPSVCEAALEAVRANA